MVLKTLKEQAAEDKILRFATGLPWVDAAVYTPQIGDPVSVNVILKKEGIDEPDTYETKVFSISITIKALLVDLGQTPTAKTGTAPGDIFTINSVEYKVTGIEDLDNNFVTCKVQEN